MVSEFRLVTREFSRRDRLLYTSPFVHRPYGCETPSSGFVTNCMAAAERKALALECIRFASSIYGSNSEILKEEYGRRKEQRVKHKCKREKKRRAQVVLEGCRLKTSNRLPPSFSQCAGAFASTPGALWYPSRVPFVEYLPCRSTC